MMEIISFYGRITLDLYLGYLVAIYLRDKYEAGDLSGPMKYPAFAVVFALYCLDIFVNWCYTVPFGELPRDWNETVSMRLARYVKDDTSPKRQTAAKFIGHVLNWTDPGHIPGA